MTSAHDDTSENSVEDLVASDLRAIEWELSEIARRIEAVRQQLQAIRERPNEPHEREDFPRGAL